MNDPAAARLVAVTAWCTVLNPLNSSMIAVALVSMQRDFEVSVATASWLVSGFYLTAAAALPVMGRLIDQFGARRLLLAGLATVVVVCALAPFAPHFGWVLAARVGLALGTSTTFPAALAIIRDHTPPDAPDQPARALAMITIANSTSAAIGPVLGGILVASAGWPGIFLINVPLAALGFVAAFRVLPPTPSARGKGPLLRRLDIPGVICFVAALISLLTFLLALPDGVQWWLAGALAAFGAAFVRWERRAAEPFVDLRDLAANPALGSVLTQQVVFNLAYYCLFFGLPIWLETGRGVDPDVVGLLMLPIATVGVLMTPVAAIVIRRRGSQAALTIGALAVLTGSLVMQLLGDSTALLVIALLAFLFGLPNGFSNLGLQTALYDAVRPERTASSGGLFQTGRYLGSIMSTSVIGIVFSVQAGDGELHRLGAVVMGCAVALLAFAARTARPGRSGAP